MRFFFRKVYHALEIRRKLLLNLMLSDMPGISKEEKSRLLHCVVVGGGPTGVEFSGELGDFIMRDVLQTYAHVKDYIHITLIEANEILFSFDDCLRHYATKQLTKQQLGYWTAVDIAIILLTLWSFQNFQVEGLALTSGYVFLPCRMCLRLVIAVGFLESTGKPTFPALAQVAERQGKYL
ncbi:hypothetical protein SLA2020_348470 [Shorea laevis]